MKVNTYGLLAAMLMALAVPAFAQQPPTPPQPPAPRSERADLMRPRMLNVEAALRFKQELKLSDSQVAQLETVRKEIVAQRQAEARDAIEIRSRVAAGLLAEEEARKQFESKRDEMRQRMDQHRDRVTKILTREQQDLLQREVRERVMDRMDARKRGRHGRMGAGLREGMRPGMRARERMAPGFMPRPRGFGEN